MKAMALAALLLTPTLAMAQTPPPAAPEKCDGYISAAFAKTFAADWIDAWNSHDLNRILANYTDDFEMSSPFIITAKAISDPSGTLKGKAKIATYWAAGVNSQNFELIDVYGGAHAIAIHYTRLNSPVGSPLRTATEVEEFNPACKVVRSSAMYGGKP